MTFIRPSLCVKDSGALAPRPTSSFLLRLPPVTFEFDPPMQVKMDTFVFQPQPLQLIRFSAVGAAANLALGIYDAVPRDGRIIEGAQGIADQASPSGEAGEPRYLSVSRHLSPGDSGDHVINVAVGG